MMRTKLIGWAMLLGVPGALALSALPANAAPRPADATPVASHLHIRLSASSLIVGQPLSGTVVVTPRAAGIAVLFQRQRAHRWQNLAIGMTDAKGAVTRPLRLKAVGTYKIRATVVASATTGAGTSPTDVVVVSPVPPPYAGGTLAAGAGGPQVLALEQRLTQLGYWLGSPGSYFGDATQQAVFAFQKAAGLNPTGVVGPSTVAALQSGPLPVPRSKSGYVIEVDLHKDLVMFVNNGTIVHVLNTSTGGGYTYSQDGGTYQAITPTGVFHIGRVVNGLVVDTLGSLWRPRFFYEGFAIHGDSYVPSIPVSHGCVRVSNEAIDWIWANNLAPIGTEVWVYG